MDLLWSTETPIYKNIAIPVQFNTSHQVSTRNNNKHQSSSRQNNSTRNYNNTGSKKPVPNVNNITGKSTMGIKYSVKQRIENRKTVNNKDKYHTKIQIITEKKRVPDNIFLIKNKKQRKNISIINKSSTIKEISKKSTNTKSQ